MRLRNTIICLVPVALMAAAACGSPSSGGGVSSTSSALERVDREGAAAGSQLLLPANSPATTCPFSTACPPGEYNLTTTGYDPKHPSAGCSTTPPASGLCESVSPAVSGDTFPAFVAPNIVTVTPPGTNSFPTPAIAMGPHTVYAIGQATAGGPSAIYAWGDNTYGQLGDGTTISSTALSAPVVPFYSPTQPVFQIVAGETDACALVEPPNGSYSAGTGNTVYCWGEIMTSPGAVSHPLATQIPIQSNSNTGPGFPNSDWSIQKIAHGAHHACALSYGASVNGPRVYCWGNNNKGQLGLDPGATAGVDPGAQALTAVEFPQQNTTTPYPFQILDIAASGDSTCALGYLTNPVIGPDAGITTTGDREIWCWGDDGQDSLGDGHGTPGMHMPFQPVSSTPSLKVPTGAGGEYSFDLPLVGASNVSPGKAGSFCARTLGQANAAQPWYCWGADHYGQLDLTAVLGTASGVFEPQSGNEYYVGVVGPTLISGNSDAPSPPPFIAVGANHGCIGSAQGGAAQPLYCFGDNDEGQLGLSGSIDGGNNESISTSNEQLQPGLWLPVNEGATPDSVGVAPAPVPLPTGFVGYNEFAVGQNFTCGAYTGAAPSATGNIVCWGNEGSFVNSTQPQALNWVAETPVNRFCSILPILCRGNTSSTCTPETNGCCAHGCESVAGVAGVPACALTTGGTAGNCPPGQYVNTVTSATSPLAPTPQCSFNTPGVVCAVPQSTTFPAPTTTNTALAPVITQVAVGAKTVYGLGTPMTEPGVATTSAVYAWGDNTFFQLGDGTTISSNNITPPTVPLFIPGNSVVQIGAGDYDACGRMADGTVYCWGEIVTAYGEIVRPTATQVALPVTGTTAATATWLAHGQHHACVVSQSPTANQVYCWGNNDKGQLGLNPFYEPEVDPLPTSVTSDYDPPSGVTSPVAFPQSVLTSLSAGTYTISSLAASGDSTCALLTAPAGKTGASQVYCWGDDAQGSLGDGAGGPNSVPNYIPQLVQGIPSGSTVGQIVGGSNGSAEEAGSFCAQVSTSGTPVVTRWYCWGASSFGQLDTAPAATPFPGTDFPQGLLTATQGVDGQFNAATTVALGAHQSCSFVSSTGANYCFGDNDQGQLGIAPSTTTPNTHAINVGTPTAITTAVAGIRPMAPSSISGIGYFNQLAMGSTFTCGAFVPPTTLNYASVPPYGNLACWGSLGNVLSSSTPTLLTWGAATDACQNITLSTNASVCGCLTAADCPADYACDTTQHVCTQTCGGGTDTYSPCNGGCCSGSNQCQAGTLQDNCGNTGGLCEICGAGNDACVPTGAGGVCGCNVASDCAGGQSCNTTTHQCSTTCNETGFTGCNGGCCSGTTCVAGTATTACGGSGGTCSVCTNIDANSTCYENACAGCGLNGPLQAIALSTTNIEATATSPIGVYFNPPLQTNGFFAISSPASYGSPGSPDCTGFAVEVPVQSAANIAGVMPTTQPSTATACEDTRLTGWVYSNGTLISTIGPYVGTWATNPSTGATYCSYNGWSNRIQVTMPVNAPANSIRVVGLAESWSPGIIRLDETSSPEHTSTMQSQRESSPDAIIFPLGFWSAEPVTIEYFQLFF